MAIASLSAEVILPTVRQARWSTWLVALALVCTVGVISIEATHHHETLASELACPVCHVAGHNAPNLFKPVLVPVVAFAGWYHHVLFSRVSAIVRNRLSLRPQPRAPPVPALSFV